MNLNNITTLTFDCYGTLIDWESGIISALNPFLIQKGIRIEAEEILTLYSRFEPEAEAGEFKSYRRVLQLVMEAFSLHFDFELINSEQDLLANSIGHWPAFPDTVEALIRLSNKFALCIISNIDADLITKTLPHLQVPFSHIIAASEVGSYKPSHSNFLFAKEKIGIQKSEMLHCAQSLYHDIAPTNTLSIQNCWVNRRKGKSGSGATPLSDSIPNFEVSDLKGLADWLC